MAQITEYITGERACDKCEYNLQGLPMNGKCPECGHPIRRAASHGPRTGTMSVEASTRFVKYLLSGFLVLTVSIIGILLGSVLVGGFAASTNPPIQLVGGMFWVGVHALWPIGVWIVTTQRPKTEGMVPGAILDNERYRLGVRLLASAWAVKAVFSYILIIDGASMTPMSNSMSLLVTLIYLASSAVSWIGLLPTCIYLGEIAFWSSNDALGARLRSTAWAMGVFGTLFVLMTAIALTPLPVRGLAGFVAIFSIFITIGATLVFMATVIQLANVLHWVIKHQDYAAGSQDRVTERMNAQIDRPGHISNGLVCQKCRYDLDGLPYGGNCPECGTSYADITPLPIRDPALTARDEPEIELEQSTHQPIRQYEQHSTGEDDGPIPLA